MAWSVRGEEQPHELVDARNKWLAEAVDAGKTEKDVVPALSDDGKISERLWSSVEAAEEWKTFLENLAQENGLTVEVTISS